MFAAKIIISIIALSFFSSTFLFAAGQVKEFVLIAKEVSWEILPGIIVNAFTFNGIIPGPELRVKEGDSVRIRVLNQLKDPTAIHWHGLEVPYNMDGVPGITQAPIPPGKEFTYKFVAKPAGVRFYHSHYNEAVQMTNAMHGAFIIDPAGAPKDKPDKHYILFLTEWNTEKGSMKAMGEMDFNYYTINGKAFPSTEILRVKKGERIRLSVINMGVSYHPMHLHGHQFKIVAKDGNQIAPQLQELRNVVPLLPGESYDIDFLADNPGIWAFHCHEVHHILNNGMEPGGLIALVVYEGYEKAVEEKIKSFLPVKKM